MKLKYFASLFSLLLLLPITSCREDVLDVDPVNSFLTDNYFTTDDQVFDALVSAYDPMGWSIGFGDWISTVMYGEIRSDNANAGGENSNTDQIPWQEVDDFTERESNSLALGYYRRWYAGVLRANLVLERPEYSSALLTRYQAEAKFLRAYYHFQLFKFFGPIPVLDRVLTPDDVGETRNTMTEVFTAITQDLAEAIEELPVVVGSAETGRATRGAAQALLGKAYLYWADMDNDDAAKFDLAATNLQAVVNSGQYALVDDFNELWAFGSKNTVESIIEVQHTDKDDSNWGNTLSNEGNAMVQLCGIRSLCSDHPLYESGWGFLLPTASLYDHFKDDDTYRRDAATISVAELEGDCPSAPAVVVSDNNEVDFEGYWQQKYANYKGYLESQFPGSNQFLNKDPNTIVLRYADVLLMLAEALHRGGGSDAEAMSYIDEVRERAVGPDNNTFRNAQTFMTEEGVTLLELIWYERRAELAGEGHRWFDLVRSGRATAEIFNGDPLRSGNFSPEQVWLPIGLEETNVAPGLTTYPSAKLFQ
ncbi:MAG: RagB/SusD family nutrient uptake outer membrane protein [Bacteroidota bacterium]